jgi:multimeric flavodoxin WrbA
MAMASDMTRRTFLGAAVAAGAATGALAAAARAEAPAAKSVKIIGISCSPRRGKTTAAAVTIALEAAKGVGPNVETQLIELAGLGIGVYDPGNEAATQGGFKDLIPVLADAKVGGLILGSPVYFGNMSSLCKAFLDHCMVLRRQDFALRNKVAGVVAVGSARNGGQELVIASIQATLMCHEMILVGDGRPTAHRGATLWNQKDDIAQDEFGVATAKNLGRRVAEVALGVAGGSR